MNLEILKSYELALEVGITSSPQMLKRVLSKNKTILDIKENILQNKITADEVEIFVNNLMKDFHKGTLFPHELALASLSVVFEGQETEFAKKFLTQLSSINISEMYVAPYVAKLCLAETEQEST